MAGAPGEDSTLARSPPLHVRDVERTRRDPEDLHNIAPLAVRDATSGLIPKQLPEHAILGGLERTSISPLERTTMARRLENSLSSKGSPPTANRSTFVKRGR